MPNSGLFIISINMVCDGLNPGPCKEVCFNAGSLIERDRYWILGV